MTNTSPFGSPQLQQNGMFSQFGANTQQQQQFNSPFGQTGNASFFGAANNAKLGGMNCGVPTSATNCFGNTAARPFQAVTSKNTTKLEAKNKVKCIAALDQFTGMSK